MTTKTDNFSTSENPLGAVNGKWTTWISPGLKGVSGTGANGVTNGVAGGSIWNASDYTFLSDQTAEVTVTTVTTLDSIGVLVRADTGLVGNGYTLRTVIDAGLIRLNRIDAGARTTLAQYTVAIANGDKFKLKVAGSAFSLEYNGVAVNWDGALPSVSDATYSSGQPGLYYFAGNINATIATLFTATDAGGGGTLNLMGQILT